ncbi:CopY/TcrY family copper transport repressor [Lactococcus kimchii]|uniref:CopY/TcrY family copper transport repressor n=1 Tax=Lactococcus sp. S-13 TaxID=2507158 RepID=UPI001023EAAF|nr:CopY/TcrY family copper transport repressor [Lactococcus sp. S-13]RZI48522.1 CopY/TcrY family copper transport repressor [Lactococcus sp. S-13]
MNEVEFNVSNAELIVMRVIWSLGEARVDEIYAQIPQNLEWSLATVKTLLGRLVKKEMLSTQKEGRKFIYKPLMAECTAINLMAEGLLEKVCATKQVNILQEMIEKSMLTAQDIELLKTTLDTKEVVAEKHCNCLEKLGACACKHEQMIA